MRGVGEASCILDLINVLENFPMFSKPKDTCQQGTSSFAFILNSYVFLGPWSPYVPISLTFNLLKSCLMSVIWWMSRVFCYHFMNILKGLHSESRIQLNQIWTGPSLAWNLKFLRLCWISFLAKSLSCPIDIAKRLQFKPSPGRRVREVCQDT